MLGKLLSSLELSALAQNVSSLGALQFANYVLPFITFPYLAQTLGAENFGAVAFANVTVVYFSILVDYGFNLTGTQSVSNNRENLVYVRELLTAVYAVKIILLTLSLFLFSTLLGIVDRFRSEYIIFIFSFGTVIGQALMPTWLFHGLEKMKPIAFFGVAGKLIYVCSIFLMVKTQDDYLMVPILLSLTSIFVSIASLVYMKYKLNIWFSKPNLQKTFLQFLDGWPIFFSTVSMSIYASSASLILGLFANNSAVGIYAVAEKITQAMKALYSPIAQALFPLVSRKITEDKILGLSFLKFIGVVACSLMLLVCSLVYFFSDIAVNLLAGDEYVGASNVLKILAFTPFLVACSNILGIQGMVNLGFKRQFSRLTFLCGIFGVSAISFAAYTNGGIGVAVGVVFSEIFILSLIIIFLVVKYRRNEI